MNKRVVTVFVFLGLASAVLSRLPAISATAGGDPVIAAAGDLCGNCGPTAKLVSAWPTPVDIVMPLGDEVYPCGDLGLFQTKYDPKWGVFFTKTDPVVGNHEYQASSSYPGCNTSATGYYDYFGSSAHGP